MAFALSLFSIAFIKYHQSKRESELSATIVAMVAITLILATVALQPIDVFLVSSTVDSHTGLKKNWADADTVYWMTFTVQVMYYGKVEYEAQGQTKSERRHLAFKYALFFITICGLLFFFGLFLKPNILPPHIDLEWFKNLLTESSKSKIDAEYDEIHHRLALVRERQQLIESKYSGSDELPLDAHDYRTLENLNDEERILVRRLNGIEQDKANFLQRLVKLCKPFKVLIGVILIICTMLVMVSILMTSVDKLSFSVCGRKCGYIISQTRLFNPVNLIFVQLQKLFPLDYMFMVGIVIYFLLATMMGIIQIGVRFLWVTLYRIRKGSTAPQGLLFSAILLTFGLLALTYSITSVVAPGYAHYGSQVYCNHTERGSRDCSVVVDMIVPCDIYAPLEICTPTWAFLLVFTFGFLISLFKSTPTYQSSREEEEGLLDGH
ncbi:hypothetical protein HPULCUR_004747 [Helicostylum pulchrum]|uniref:LMBR1 domain-containing protein 1 n=1 Tax=Helicostylum pulchrum TaxID=562976 RepID=A0ABP9XX56_9FUNG